MILQILRGAFLLLVASVASLYLLPFQWADEVSFVEFVGFAEFVVMLGVTLAIALVVIGIDLSTPCKKLSAVSGVFLGLLAGLLAAYALSFVVNLIGVLVPPPRGVTEEKFINLLDGVKVFIGLVTCYVGISLVLQTKDDFRFVIPYVEFSKQIRGTLPTLLDTSAIIDGRVTDVVETHVLQGPMIVPKFVLNELQAIADSPDKLRRARGRRGLDVLAKLQASQDIEVTIDDADAQGNTVDQKLVALGQQMQARIMTCDYNLMKISNLRGVEVINLNDLAKALRPVVLPGEQLSVTIIKPGEAAGQGVGYLADGTMVVVENSRRRVGEQVDMLVTSTLQTSAGRMIFGKVQREDDEPALHRPEDEDSAAEAIRAEPVAPIKPPATPTPAPTARVPRGRGRNPRR
jgi:uncharacterized protein YacL